MWMEKRLRPALLTTILSPTSPRAPPSAGSSRTSSNGTVPNSLARDGRKRMQRWRFTGISMRYSETLFAEMRGVPIDEQIVGQAAQTR